jgi:drug/metabolite transporter (DMT)-like permease
VRYAFAGAVTFAFSFPLDKQAVLASSGIFFSVCVVLALGVVSLLMSFRTNHFRDNLKSIAGKRNDILLMSFLHGVGFFLTTQSLPYTLAVYASSIKRLWSFWAVLFSGKLLQEKNIGTRIVATFIMLAGIAITLLFN